MPSSPTSPSPFRSRTDALGLALAALATLPGCGGGDTCGPGSAAESGLVASAAGVTLTFGAMTAGQNNDCPAADAPAGVISLTIRGGQTDDVGSGSAGRVTMCVSRPDLLGSTQLALGPDVGGSEVRLIDLGGTSNGCSFALDPTRLPTGTVTATGLCGNGSDAAGFALVVAGAASLTRTCGAVVDTVGVTLTGTVAVHPQ